MLKQGRSLAVVVLAVCAVAAMGGAAQANTRIGFSPTEGELSRVEARSSAITFTDPEGSFRITCEVIRTLRLNSLIAKTEGVEMGTVTAARLVNCSGGVVKLLTEPPWRLTYVSFTGTLPNIREVRFEIRHFAFLIETFGGTSRCLFIGDVQETTSGSPINSLVFDETVLVSFGKNLGFGECPSSAIVSGTLRLRPIINMRLF